jgi:hypothetical protein
MPTHNLKDAYDFIEVIRKHPTNWLPDEDAKLRGKHWKWHEISEQLPSRSANACLQHHRAQVEISQSSSSANGLILSKNNHEAVLGN